MTTIPDKREAILDRLEVAFGTVAGVKAFRNTLDVPEKDRPAVVILDADEAVEDESPDGRGRSAPAGAPIVVTMTPEIYILTAAKGAKTVGAELNRLRSQLIKTVMLDETLLSLVKDRDIRYLGFATGLASGRSIEGEAGISFRFRYVINPTTI